MRHCWRAFRSLRLWDRRSEVSRPSRPSPRPWPPARRTHRKPLCFATPKRRVRRRRPPSSVGRTTQDPYPPAKTCRLRLLGIPARRVLSRRRTHPRTRLTLRLLRPMIRARPRRRRNRPGQRLPRRGPNPPRRRPPRLLRRLPLTSRPVSPRGQVRACSRTRALSRSPDGRPRSPLDRPRSHGRKSRSPSRPTAQNCLLCNRPWLPTGRSRIRPPQTPTASPESPSRSSTTEELRTEASIRAAPSTSPSRSTR